MQARLFIGGEFVDAVDGHRLEVLSPHDCSVITEIAEARAAFPGWRRTFADDDEAIAIATSTDYGLGAGLSGYGRTMGFEARREDTEAKSVRNNVDAQIPAWCPR